MEVDRIVRAIKEPHIGDPWTGTSLSDLPDSLTWQQAATAIRAVHGNLQGTIQHAACRVAPMSRLKAWSRRIERGGQ